jgi:hypothetical protein
MVSYITYHYDIAGQEPLRICTDSVTGSSGSTILTLGSTVWDAGICLAKYFEHMLCKGEDNLKAMAKFENVVELGCGTGVVGLALNRLLPNSTIILTDKLDVLDACIETLQRHPQPKVSVFSLNWDKKEDSEAMIKKFGVIPNI